MKRNVLTALAASLTLGLAPFLPEPHVVGKVRWVLGGGDGMGPMDYFDLVMHGGPWLWLAGALLLWAVEVARGPKRPTRAGDAERGEDVSRR